MEIEREGVREKMGRDRERKVGREMRVSVRIERLHHRPCNQRIVGVYMRSLIYREIGEYKSLVKIFHLYRWKIVQSNAKT